MPSKENDSSVKKIALSDNDRERFGVKNRFLSQLAGSMPQGAQGWLFDKEAAGCDRKFWEI